MPYTESKEYAKYLKGKIESGCSEGCSECSETSTTDDCGCCPPGLVAVYDGSGNKIGCLTPGDAELYNTNNRTCPEGFLTLYKNGTPNVFYGCVSEAEFATLYAAINP